jgi:hypothetical protein
MSGPAARAKPASADMLPHWIDVTKHFRQDGLRPYFTICDLRRAFFSYQDAEAPQKDQLH